MVPELSTEGKFSAIHLNNLLAEFLINRSLISYPYNTYRRPAVTLLGSAGLWHGEGDGLTGEAYSVSEHGPLKAPEKSGRWTFS